MTGRNERCDGCKWWEAYPRDADTSGAHFDVRENGDATGWCHRYPPAPNVLQQVAESRDIGEDDVKYPEFNFHWNWPATLSSDFCGECARSGGTQTTVLGPTCIARLLDVDRAPYKYYIAWIVELVDRYGPDDICRIHKVRKGTKRWDFIHAYYDRVRDAVLRNSGD